MTRTSARLLAAVAASAALLGITTGPAHAQYVVESSSALYAFESGDRHEELLLEAATTPQSNDFQRPSHATGRTDAHPGWDFRFSDEAVGAGLPAQDATAQATVRPEGDPAASASSFISLVDQSPTAQPFLVIRSANSLWCWAPSGKIRYDRVDNAAFYRRDADNRLVEFNPLAGAVPLYGVTPGDRQNDGTARPTTVTVSEVYDRSHIASYRTFAKYADRQFAGVIGYQAVITQTNPDQSTTTYSLLLNTTAVSC